MAAITNVDLDHMDRLGSTVTAIAREKAAIIDAWRPCRDRRDRRRPGVIRRRAARVGAPLRLVAAGPVARLDRDGIKVELAGLGPTRVGLRGRHQAANVAVADAILDALADGRDRHGRAPMRAGRATPGPAGPAGSS